RMALPPEALSAGNTTPRRSPIAPNSKALWSVSSSAGSGLELDSTDNKNRTASPANTTRFDVSPTWSVDVSKWGFARCRHSAVHDRPAGVNPIEEHGT